MRSKSSATVSQGEDCLFLDLYVPAASIQNAKSSNANTPVVVWLFGGAIIFGSKNPFNGGPLNTPFYDGAAAVTRGEDSIIFVAGNYRLGAYGWLAGPTMRSQGYPNAGLSDQRLVFQFVQDLIHLVGGDPTQVSAWGESAGAGSIIHHLIGNIVPNFKRVALQSPAFEWQWDNRTMASADTHQVSEIIFSLLGNSSLGGNLSAVRRHGASS